MNENKISSISVQQVKICPVCEDDGIPCPGQTFQCKAKTKSSFCIEWTCILHGYKCSVCQNGVCDLCEPDDEMIDDLQCCDGIHIGKLVCSRCSFECYECKKRFCNRHKVEDGDASASCDCTVFCDTCLNLHTEE